MPKASSVWSWTKKVDEVERDDVWEGECRAGGRDVIWRHHGEEIFRTEEGVFSSLSAAKEAVRRRWT